MMLKKLLLTLALSTVFPLHAVQANEPETLHIYSSRHYSTDEALYTNFTAETGIEVKRVDGKGDALIARLTQEGALSPADLLITVDSGRLWRAENAGLFQPVESEILNAKIPENLRHPEGLWYSFSKRARVLVYNTNTVKADALTSYNDLTDPQWKGRVCVRSSSNIYNLSLLSSLIATEGAEAAQSWAQGVLDNLARKPQGGDTDQIKAVAAGICDVALVNGYYFFRLQRSDKEADHAVVKDLALVYPDQDGNGTHVNVSGAGVLKHAKNKEAAIKFLEYLTTDQAQTYFADGNNEFPVVADVHVNDIVESQKSFHEQDVNVREFGVNQKNAQMIFDTIAFP